MRTLLCSSAAIALSVLTACGSGNGTTVPASIRVVNDAPDAVTLSLNGLTTISAQASDTTSAYATVAPSTYTLSVATATLTGAATTIGLGTGQNYTALAYERGKNVYSAVYTDNQAIPSTGFSSLNVANVSSDAGPLDIYLVKHGTTSLVGYQPTFSSVQGLSTATTLASTTATCTGATDVCWDIIVTRAAVPTDVRLTLSNPIFASAQPYTLGLTATAGGGLVNAVLIPQSLTTAVYTPSTQARVRVWSALPTASAAAVVATVGTTALNVDYAPSPTQYQLVPAGSAVTALTIGGTAIGTLPAGTFAAGGDYTILVYGTGSPAGAPAALILTDTNQVVANYASVRLINAAVTGSAGLTMYVGGSESASTVPYPTAATATDAYGYSGVKTGSAVPLLLLGAGYTGPQTATQFTTGSVYTVMVYDATQAPLITQDR